MIIEQIFSLPGIGQQLLQAIHTRDCIVVEAIVLVFAIVAVLANLVADVLYAVLDPRIRYGSQLLTPWPPRRRRRRRSAAPARRARRWPRTWSS